MRTLPNILLVVFAICSQGTAFGWNDTGHMTVADIAWQDLSAAQRDKASAILKNHPRYNQDLLAGLPAGFDRDQYAFMKAATWPDMVRSPANPMHFVADHPAWHFIDYPFNEDGMTGPQPVETWDGKSDPQNILQALDKCIKEFQAPNTAAAQRAIDLCWIEHLVGDIHQPLHCAARFDKQFPQDDRGGNSLIVLVGDKPTPLHTYWDHIFGDETDPNAIAKLSAQIRADPRCTRQAFQAQLKEPNFKAWAIESFDDARTVAYDNGNLLGADEQQFKANPKMSIPALTPAYEKSAYDTAQSRVALAGYRLADLLAKILN